MWVQKGGKNKYALNETSSILYRKTSRIFFVGLLLIFCKRALHYLTHMDKESRRPCGDWAARKQHQASNGVEPLPRPNTSLQASTPEWQCWTQHERLKQMLTQVQIDGEESLTVQQTCVHCATTTLRRLTHQRSSERTPAMSGFVCATVRVRAHAFAVFLRKNIRTLGRKKKVTVHVCVHKRAHICMWERLGSVWLHNNVSVCLCWEMSVCLCAVLNGGSVRRCKCGRTVCGCAASGFGSGFL